MYKTTLNKKLSAFQKITLEIKNADEKILYIISFVCIILRFKNLAIQITPFSPFHMLVALLDD